MSTQVYLTVEKSPLNLETRLVELFSPESEELAATEQESQDEDRELTLLERLDRQQTIFVDGRCGNLLLGAVFPNSGSAGGF